MPLCPICSKPAAADTKPFCSVRCREVDFNRWFNGSYAVPSAELDDADSEELEAAVNLMDEDSSKH